MTLKQLKQILDGGGIIASQEQKVIKENSQYIHSGNIEGEPFSIVWRKLESFITNPSEWSEVKQEPPIHNILQKPITNTLSRAYILPETKGFAPPIICIDVREWEAMQKELEELRTFKASHWSTFDAPTEYGK
jgi:hypothetical protein